jgi:hypothetical protein
VLTLGRIAIEARGGTVAYADTDSLYPVSGGRVVACPGGSERTDDGREGVAGMSGATVREVRLLMEDLSLYPEDLRPTDRRWVDYPTGRFRGRRTRQVPVGVPGALFLKLEAENFAGGPSWPTQAYLWALAPKRYDVYQLRKPGLSSGVGWVAEPSEEDIRTLTEVIVVKASEHALTYRDPTGNDNKVWVNEGTEYLNRKDLGYIAPEREWFDEPGLFVITLTDPQDLAKIAGPKDRRNPLRPWSRVAVGVPVYRSADDKRVVPVAPWFEGANPHALDWGDAASGERIDVRTETAKIATTDLLDTWVTIRSMRGVLAAHARGYDATALGPDGEWCGARAKGLCQPAPTTGHGFYLIGKETRRMQVVGILQDPEYVTYAEPNPWPDVRAALERLEEVPEAFRRIAAIGDVHVRTVERARQDIVNAKTKHILLEAVAAYLREGGGGPADCVAPEAAIAEYLRHEHVLPRRCVACGAPLTRPRKRYCSPACRQRSYRERKGV